MARLKRSYTYSKPRGDLWDAHRTDRDRTTERIELGLRAHDALTTVRCTYVADDRRCVKVTHGNERQHLLATIWTLDDLIGLPTKAEEATA